MLALVYNVTKKHQLPILAMTRTDDGRSGQPVMQPLRDRIQNCPVGHVRSFQYAAKNFDKATIDETGAKKRGYPVTSKFN